MVNVKMGMIIQYRFGMLLATVWCVTNQILERRIAWMMYPWQNQKHFFVREIEMRFTIVIGMLAAICMADNELCYHNGTPQWYVWGGVYRGTWFDLEDFFPGNEDFLVEWAEIWFFESSMNPWDTDQFTVELWNGDQNGPVEFLASEEGTAQGSGKTVINFVPPVEAGENFWCIVNTELSAGGWPSILTDGVPTGHSFFSGDFAWEPFDLGNYMMSVGNGNSASLSRMSWGAIKAVF